MASQGRVVAASGATGGLVGDVQPDAGSDGRRGPRDRMRGRSRPLSDRAAGYAARAMHVDRAGRFRRRREEVAALRRRRRLLGRLGWLSVVVGTTVAGALVGEIADGFAAVGGALVGAGAGGLGVGLYLLMSVAARRRGARAWDWQAQRYRLIGDPSRRVQRMDEPRSS